MYTMGMLTLLADTIKVEKPQTDGRYVITIACEAYNRSEIAKVAGLPANTLYEITIGKAGWSDEPPSIDLTDLLS